VNITRVHSLVVFAALVIGLFFYFAFRKPKLVPGKLQWAAESVYDFIRNGVVGDVIGPSGLKFAPYITILFCFIFVNNFFEILPLAQMPVTSRFAFPVFLAI